MKPPKDINNLDQCIKLLGNDLYIYCVECNRWTEARIAYQGQIIYDQSGVAVQTIPASEPAFVCRVCHADIGYLLNEIQRYRLLNRARLKVQPVTAKEIKTRQARLL